MAKQEVYTFASADNKSTIHCRKWMPEGEPVAILQLVHGMVEYIERYDEFADYMTKQGFLVVGHDHIGHGDSVASEEEWGVMEGEHPSDIMVEDIYTHYCMTKKANDPHLPYFILGHSMGSYMLRKFLSVKGSKLAGLNGAIIMGTGTEQDGTIKAGLNMIKVLSAIKGKKFRSTFIQGMMYGGPYKQFDCYGKDYSNSWLSKNVENVEKYYHDPKCTFVFTLNGYKGLVESTLYDNQPENIAKMRKDMPLLVVSGQDDPVGNMGKGVEAASEKFKAAGIEDVTLKLFENDRHEILNELDRDQVYEYIYNWIKSKM